MLTLSKILVSSKEFSDTLFYRYFICSKMLSLFKTHQIQTQLIRNYGKHNKKYLYRDEDKMKFGKIIYYPRTPDHKDPPITPSKLFRVQRVKPVKGNPYWEKRILKDLGLDGKQSDFTVVKNIPENNARLWKIKHLLKITPITFPYGEPTENDINNTILKENGECLVAKELKISDQRIEATEIFEKDANRLDGETLRKDSRLKWLNAW
ncbi:39S ribosomal protein L30, mitochondrial [Condylostylus longicornis]|uniref:39S ribosomal protein L30, mitochondrial n=1 Tax=Condylostylus longicornis TaxID=2530218 RepID=UPI00244E3B85|nr:39S ribosomal protein L30, mitochondrial [Condylostylus longicornis]